jgi:hypothetical protein
MMSDPPETELLTYAELGERLGISTEGARTRAKRMRWPRYVGNDGLARVRVPRFDPGQVLVQGRDEPGQARVNDRPAGHERLTRVNELEARVEALQQRLAQAETEVERWRTEADRERATAIRAVADREAARAVAIAEVEAAKRVAEAEIAAAKAEAQAKDLIIAELRRPWWRKLLGQ